MSPEEGQQNCLPAVEHHLCQVAGRGAGGRPPHPPAARAGSSCHSQSHSQPHSRPQCPARCTAETVTGAGQCPPQPHAPLARLQPYPLHCAYPSSPTLTSNLMACSSGFRGARPLLGGWGGGRKRKPGSVKPGAPSPRTLRVPVTHPRRPRTMYSGRRHLCCSGSCPSHCRAQVRAVSPGILLWPPGPLNPAWAGAGTQGTGVAFLPPGKCPLSSCQRPLTLFSTALTPSWNDSVRCHAEVRC